MNNLKTNLCLCDVFLNQGTNFGVATVQDTEQSALAITERVREASPLADADWEQLSFGLGFLVRQSLSLRKLLAEFQHNLAITPDDFGCTGITYHTIDTGSSSPVHQHSRRVALTERQNISSQFDEMLYKEVVSPSHSPWSPPVVLVRKKDVCIRFRVDYRKLNSVTKPEVYSLPRLDDTIDRLGGAKWFFPLDLAS